MSIKHLELLRKALGDNHWIVLEELPGNDYEISGYWRVAKPNGDSEMNLAFEGLDDLETLPIEKAYGCHVLENKETSIYFGKVSKSYPLEISAFVKDLSQV